MKPLPLGLLIVILAAIGVAPGRASFLIDPTGGTVLWGDTVGADDAVIRRATIGFEFSFFDEIQPTIDVSTNGNLNFSGDSGYANESILAPILRISPLWDDLEIVAGSGDAVTEKVVPGKYYAVTWRVHERGAATRHAFQAVLFGAAMRINGLDFIPGDIVFSYDTVGPTFAKDSATVGLDSGDGGTVIPAPGARSEFAILPHSEAALLPSDPGGFILFRLDESAEYIATTHINRLPQATDDTHYSAGRTGFTIPVLANDADPNGDPLVIESVTQGSFGNVTITADTLTYSPGPGFVGTDIFTYTVRDPYGLTDTARVTVLPFAAGRGTFDGLVSDAPEEGETEAVLTHEGTGFLKLTFGANGILSGTLKFGGFTHALRGVFDARGNFTAQFQRIVDEETQTVTITLHLDLSSESQPLTGTVTDGTVTSLITAARSRFVARSFAAPQAGRYSVLLNPDEGGSGPLGVGYALMKVAPGGAVSLVGKRGDGKAFTFGSFVKPDGTFAFHLTMPAGRAVRAGSLFGIVKFDETLPLSDCSATLQWFMPDVGEVSGFEAAPVLIGSRYRPPAKGTRVIPLPDGTKNAWIDLAGGEITRMLTITDQNKVRVEDGETEKLTLTINPTAGTFIGSFIEESFDDPPIRKRRVIRGVFLQKMKVGGGLFIGPDGSAPATIAPPVPQ